jgi:hypothetical protein
VTQLLSKRSLQGIPSITAHGSIAGSDVNGSSSSTLERSSSQGSSIATDIRRRVSRMLRRTSDSTTSGAACGSGIDGGATGSALGTDVGSFRRRVSRALGLLTPADPSDPSLSRPIEVAVSTDPESNRIEELVATRADSTNQNSQHVSGALEALRLGPSVFVDVSALHSASGLDVSTSGAPTASSSPSLIHVNAGASVAGLGGVSGAANSSLLDTYRSVISTAPLGNRRATWQYHDASLAPRRTGRKTSSQLQMSRRRSDLESESEQDGAPSALAATSGE